MVQMKEPSMLDVWIFSRTTHFVSGLVYILYVIIFAEFITETYSTMVNVSYWVKTSGQQTLFVSAIISDAAKY